MQEEIKAVLAKSFEMKVLTTHLFQTIEYAFKNNHLTQKDIKALIQLCFEWVKHEPTITSASVNWLQDCTELFEKTLEGQLFVAEFAPEDDIRATALRFIHNTNFSFDLCMYTLSDDILTEAILELHERGVAVRIICDDSKSFDAGSDVRMLAKAGVPVKTDGHPELMHHKFAVIDNSIVLNGSYNWTRTAAERNYENLIVLENEGLVKAFAHAFERMWHNFNPIAKRGYHN